MAAARLAPTAREAATLGVATEEIVRHGKSPVDEVTAAAGDTDTNILVIGRRPAKDLKQRLLGDVTTHLIGQAPCHVLVAGWQATMWHNRILLASDGSDNSDGVAEMATQIAKVTRTPVTIVSAITHDKEQENAVEDLAHKAGLMKLEGIAVETRIVRGPAPEMIVRTAQEIGADLVVVGSHRGKALSRMVAGSVVDRVVGGLTCAVLIVKSGEARELGAAAAG
jgi:nucleotide-binding universal stress UspA family protein